VSDVWNNDPANIRPIQRLFRRGFFTFSFGCAITEEIFLMSDDAGSFNGDDAVSLKLSLPIFRFGSFFSTTHLAPEIF